MQTNFFTELLPLIAGCDVKLHITQSGGKISMSIMPESTSKDTTAVALEPLVLTGTAKELDDEFFSAIGKPLERATGIIRNLDEFEGALDKALEKVEKKNGGVKALVRDTKKEAEEAEEKAKAEAAEAEKKLVERKRKKGAALVKKAEELVKSEELKLAIGAYKEAKEFVDIPGAMDKKVEELIYKMSTTGTLSLFAIAAEIETFETHFGDDIDKELDALDQKAPDSTSAVNGTSARKMAAPQPASAKKKRVRPSRAKVKAEPAPDPHHVADLQDSLVRYDDATLAEFKELIDKKLKVAKEELVNLQKGAETPVDDANAKYMEQLTIRQGKYIENLEAALLRIEDKTYGICQATGNLIEMDRLRALPHTTLSMEAKLQAGKAVEDPAAQEEETDDNNKTTEE